MSTFADGFVVVSVNAAACDRDADLVLSSPQKAELVTVLKDAVSRLGRPEPLAISFADTLEFRSGKARGPIDSRGPVPDSRSPARPLVLSREGSSREGPSVAPSTFTRTRRSAPRRGRQCSTRTAPACGSCGHTNQAAADDGHVLTGSGDKAVKVWRGDELVRTTSVHIYGRLCCHRTRLGRPCSPPAALPASLGQQARVGPLLEPTLARDRAGARVAGRRHRPARAVVAGRGAAHRTRRRQGRVASAGVLALRQLRRRRERRQRRRVWR
mmetsp:Transcript_11743/g.35141  ORF Transcript_11743/g.35141 Transcript_11743/m.35141 type:complete len:270 (-) Transcript_11743:360-1169(-)